MSLRPCGPRNLSSYLPSLRFYLLSYNHEILRLYILSAYSLGSFDAGVLDGKRKLERNECVPMTL